MSVLTDLVGRALGSVTPAEAGAVYEFVLDLTGQERLATFAHTVMPAAGRILLILVVAYLANRIVRRLIRRATRRLASGEALGMIGTLRERTPLRDTTPMDLGRATLRAETIGGVLRSIASVAIWAIAVVMILGEFAINLGPLIAGAGIVGVALGFGAQKLVQDFLSGIFMLIEDQYGLGDIVDAGEAIGVIEGITLRTTRLRDINGTVWHIPNGSISRIGNQSQQWARALIDVGVAYDTDVPTAIELIERVAVDMSYESGWSELVLERPEVWGVQALADSEVTIRLVVKTRPGQQWKVEREIRKRLKAAFDTEGIEIPFPHRVVYTRRDDRRGGYLEEADTARAAASGRHQDPPKVGSEFPSTEDEGWDQPDEP